MRSKKENNLNTSIQIKEYKKVVWQMGLMGEIFYLVPQHQTGASQLNKEIGSSHILYL